MHATAALPLPPRPPGPARLTRLSSACALAGIEASIARREILAGRWPIPHTFVGVRRSILVDLEALQRHVAAMGAPRG